MVYMYLLFLQLIRSEQHPELTLADILSVPEKKEELTGGLVEVDMGDDDLGLFGDDDPFGDGDIPF